MQLYDLAMAKRQETIHASLPDPPLDWKNAAVAAHRIGAHLSELSLPSHRLAVVQVFHYRMKRGWRVNAHRHSYHEVSVILTGRARDDSVPRGRQVLGPGSVFVHGAHQAHAWSSPYGVCHRLVVCFNTESPIQIVRHLRWPCWPEMVHHAWAMLQAAHEERPGWLDRVAARMAVLLTETLALGAEALPVVALPAVETSPALQLVDRVDVFLEENLPHRIKLQDIAAQLNVSVSLLTHRYKQESGQSIGQRLVILRMEQAAHLLRETDMPLGDIGRQVGINPSAYLCRMFRRYLRATPVQYRLRYRGQPS